MMSRRARHGDPPSNIRGRASGGWGEEHANLLDRARLYFASRDPVLAGRLAEEERKARPSTRVRTGYRY